MWSNLAKRGKSNPASFESWELLSLAPPFPLRGFCEWDGLGIVVQE